MIKRIVVGSMLAAGGWAAYSGVRRLYGTWGFDPLEASKTLPGDELIPEPTTSETRGLTIDAPPEAVWPWLVQMGYGRGGWYSYDAMDMKGSSATAIDPALQDLEVGDTVPTDPDGGFLVKVVESGKALVLYVDPEIIAARRHAGAVASETAPGVVLSGRFLETATPPRFTATWAFVLEPLEAGQTRLIERFRARLETASPGSQFLGPILGFGIFVMTRRQMLGIKARAERQARGREVLYRDVDEIVDRVLAAPADAANPEITPATS